MFALLSGGLAPYDDGIVSEVEKRPMAADLTEITDGEMRRKETSGLVHYE